MWWLCGDDGGGGGDGNNGYGMPSAKLGSGVFDKGKQASAL